MLSLSKSRDIFINCSWLFWNNKNNISCGQYFKHDMISRKIFRFTSYIDKYLCTIFFSYLCKIAQRCMCIRHSCFNIAWNIFICHHIWERFWTFLATSRQNKMANKNHSENRTSICMVWENSTKQKGCSNIVCASFLPYIR